MAISTSPLFPATRSPPKAEPMGQWGNQRFNCPTSFTLPLPALVYNRNFFVTNAKKLKKVRIFGWNNY